MGFGSLSQGEGSVHDRLDLTGLDQRPDMFAHRGHDGRFLSQGSAPQRRRDHCGTFAKQGAEVEFGLDPTLESDDDQASVDRQGADVAGKILGTDVVQDYVSSEPIGRVA